MYQILCRKAIDLGCFLGLLDLLDEVLRLGRNKNIPIGCGDFLSNWRVRQVVRVILVGNIRFFILFYNSNFILSCDLYHCDRLDETFSTIGHMEILFTLFNFSFHFSETFHYSFHKITFHEKCPSLIWRVFANQPEVYAIWWWTAEVCYW